MEEWAPGLTKIIINISSHIVKQFKNSIDFREGELYVQVVLISK